MEEKTEREMTREELLDTISVQRVNLTMMHKELADLKEAMMKMEILNRKAFECLVSADWKIMQYEANQKKWLEE